MCILGEKCHRCRCSSPERWCPTLQSCSINGICNKLLAALNTRTTSTAASTPATKAYISPVDTSPPKLTLLGSGKGAITSTGAVIMLDNVTWNAEWADPGATALDAVDGNLTRLVQSFGAGELFGH